MNIGQGLGHAAEEQGASSNMPDLQQLRALFSCDLCKQAFRPSRSIQTLTECLHSFCFECITRTFGTCHEEVVRDDKGSTTCPVCHVDLGPHPHQSVLKEDLGLLEAMGVLYPILFPSFVSPVDISGVVKPSTPVAHCPGRRKTKTPSPASSTERSLKSDSSPLPSLNFSPIPCSPELPNLDVFTEEPMPSSSQITGQYRITANSKSPPLIQESTLSPTETKEKLAVNHGRNLRPRKPVLYNTGPLRLRSATTSPQRTAKKDSSKPAAHHSSILTHEKSPPNVYKFLLQSKQRRAGSSAIIPSPAFIIDPQFIEHSWRKAPQDTQMLTIKKQITRHIQPTPTSIELSLHGELLGDEWTLEYVTKVFWLDRAHPLLFEYVPRY